MKMDDYLKAGKLIDEIQKIKEKIASLETMTILASEPETIQIKVYKSGGTVREFKFYDEELGRKLLAEQREKHDLLLKKKKREFEKLGEPEKDKN